VAFRATYRVTRDQAAAQDACHARFIRAYRALDRFRIGEPFRPWLLRIVTNLAKNEVRGRSRRGGLLARLQRQATVGADSTPERALEARERHERVLDAIARLPAADREVLYLHHYLDLPEREVPAAIGRRPGTVKSRLHRAHARMRAVIEAAYPDLVPEDAAVEDVHG